MRFGFLFVAVKWISPELNVILTRFIDNVYLIPSSVIGFLRSSFGGA
jgi:hypothetical protein